MITHIFIRDMPPGYKHADIKVDNIIINETADGKVNVKVADFGVASLEEQKRCLFHKRAYFAMAPEEIISCWKKDKKVTFGPMYAHSVSKNTC